MSVRYKQAVHLVFGPCAVDEVEYEVKALGCGKTLCVYDWGVSAAGIDEKVKAALSKAGVGIVVYDKISSDPSSELVDYGASLGLRGHGAELHRLGIPSPAWQMCRRRSA